MDEKLMASRMESVRMKTGTAIEMAFAARSGGIVELFSM
jgi:hypothetical protein